MLRTGGLHDIPVHECLRLLAQDPVHVGRVGLVANGEPVVLPVNYRYYEAAVILRTASQEILEAARGQQVLAFQVDVVDPAWESGWSVLVRGQAAEVVRPERLASVPLRTWAPREGSAYVRIPATKVTGRRLA
jgi:uncharacterized protein